MTHTIKIALCWVLALFFIIAGISHFTQDDSFAAIVPPMLPFPYVIVWITGVMEIIMGIGLLIPKYRRLSGLLLAPFLLAVLPANIYMAIAQIPMGDTVMSPTVLWIRVALQFPLIALILWASHFATQDKAMN